MSKLTKNPVSGKMEQSAFSVTNARKSAPPKHYIRGKTLVSTGRLSSLIVMYGFGGWTELNIKKLREYGILIRHGQSRKISRYHSVKD